MSLRQVKDPLYSTSGNTRIMTEIFLKTKCTPPYNSVEEFIDQWISRWNEKLSPMFNDPSCSYHFKRSIWVELLDLFITEQHPEYEVYEALVLSSFDRMAHPKINALFKTYNIANNLIEFWLSCIEEYDAWIKTNMEDPTIVINEGDHPYFLPTSPKSSPLKPFKARIFPEKTLLLFKEVFATKILEVIQRL